MKNVCYLICLLVCFTKLQAQENDQNQSPYFQVLTEGISASDFPLLSTKADVHITGPVADVEVSQTYQNKGQVPMEAIYVFPLSTQAAVYHMEMKIGSKVIVAEIQEKQQARQTYERAKKEGKTASLLEQHKPNVFQMNVGNIMPEETIEVSLRYNELLKSSNKIYEFVYPTVVGPRFVGKEEQVDYANNPHSKAGVDAAFNFDIEVSMHGSKNIAFSNCKTHKINAQFISGEEYLIRLHPEEKKASNRDFILRYSFANEEWSNSTFLYEENGEKFFLSIIEPPQRENDLELAPREYIFVMDVSGSMTGFPLDVSKELMQDLVCNLNPWDKFNIMLFAGGSQLMSTMSLLATQENMEKANTFLKDESRYGGGTRLLPAMEQALGLPTDEAISSRSIVVITDGYVTVEKEVFDLISNNLDKANIFTFGIGSSVNRHLIEGMAHIGRGEPLIITDLQYAKAKARKFREYIQRPILSNIEIEFSGIEVYDVIPKTIPDLLAERPVYIFGKYKGENKGKLKLKANKGRKRFKTSLNIETKNLSPDHQAIKYLWAREQIKSLEYLNHIEHNSAIKKEITKLGLNYNLLTEHTSFVGVNHEEVVNNNGKTVKVKQVLPMPKGVTNHAIGFSMNVEEVVENGTSQSSSVLFVSMETEKGQYFNQSLHQLLTKQIVFTEEEKAFLQHNTLSLDYLHGTGQWILKDRKGLLTKAFKEQFIELLKLEMTDFTQSMTIKIDFLWV